MNFTKNTGREYSAEGQIIEVTLLTAEADDVIEGAYTFTAKFHDKTRGIKGVCTSFAFNGLTETEVFAGVLHQYDAGNYNF